jgi:hypothetical protein
MTTPNRQKVTIGMLLFWRSLITVGVGAILWLQSTFVSKESFRTWEIGHDVLRDNILKNIDDRFSDIKQSLNRIETKVERIQMGPPRRADASSKPTEFLGKPFNLGTNSIYE